MILQHNDQSLKMSLIWERNSGFRQFKSLYLKIFKKRIGLHALLMGLLIHFEFNEKKKLHRAVTG